MPYFLYSGVISLGQEFELDGPEAHHLLGVKRAQAGEMVKLQDSSGKRFLCGVKVSGKRSARLVPEKELPVPPEPETSTILYQAAVAEQAMDVVLQKSVELGAAEIVIFNSHHTAAKLSDARFRQKRQRWEKILWEAAKQCERGQVPILRYLAGICDIAADAKNLEKLFVLDITGFPLKTANYKLKTAGIVVGPEGGFFPEELRLLTSLPNSQAVSFGSFVLRSDTAAIAGLAVLRNLI